MFTAAAIDAVTKRALAGPPMPPTARVALHFHPDVDLWGRPVLQRIVAAGAYLSQFATGTSNGGLTAFAGGARWHWEHRIFNGVYDHAEPAEHPVYGAVAVDGDPYGPAPRFGSSYLRLRPAVVERSTFAYPDSVFQPSTFGVAARMAPLDMWRRDAPQDPLDHYIEAHVHGRVGVPTDVEALVLDPSFVGSGLDAMAKEAGMLVEWHPGYELGTDDLAPLADYRSPMVVEAAIMLAEDGRITPASLGRARAAAARMYRPRSGSGTVSLASVDGDKYQLVSSPYLWTWGSQDVRSPTRPTCSSVAARSSRVLSSPVGRT